MAREFTRFYGPAPKGAPGPTGTDLIPVDTPEPPPAAQPAMSSPTMLTAAQLVEAHGDAVGEAMWGIVQVERQKAAEKFRVMHTRLSEIRAEIAAKNAAAEQRMQRLQRGVDDAYGDYLAAGAQLERERVALQSELAPLNSEAEEIVRALNVPLHAGRVRQWSVTTDDRRLPGTEF